MIPHLATDVMEITDVAIQIFVSAWSAPPKCLEMMGNCLYLWLYDKPQGEPLIAPDIQTASICLEINAPLCCAVMLWLYQPYYPIIFRVASLVPAQWHYSSSSTCVKLTDTDPQQNTPRHKNHEHASLYVLKTIWGLATNLTAVTSHQLDTLRKNALKSNIVGIFWYLKTSGKWHLTFLFKLINQDHCL